MNILFTFELPALSVRAKNFINVLLHFGHEVSIYLMGDQPAEDMMKAHIKHEKFTVLHNRPSFDEFHAWYYDLSSHEWQYPTPFARNLVDFKGTFLGCINYEDGYSFFEDRTTHAVQERTCLYMNNALYLDRQRYAPRVRAKCFLTTSYIDNSQAFKDNHVPYKNKIKRVMFSGSVTGHSSILTNNDISESYLRITLAMKVHNEKRISSIIRFTGYEPTLKGYYDTMVPEELKQPHKIKTYFDEEIKNSAILLTIKGNSYPTNRFFEAHAAGALSLSTKMNSEIEIYGIGKAGKHYVEINVDGSDLINLIDYYLEHENEAIRIAENGRKVWEEHNMLDSDGLFTEKTIRYHIDEIKKITGFDIRTI